MPLKNCLLCICAALLLAAPLQAAVLASATFEVHDGSIAEAIQQDIGTAELEPISEIGKLPEINALIFDRQYQQLIDPERFSRRTLSMGLAHNSSFGLGLAGLIFMLYAARKLYQLSR